MKKVSEASTLDTPVRWERRSKMEGGKWWPCADKAEADGAVLAGWEVRPLFAIPQQVGPFTPDTVVCRRYQMAQYPGQDFYHYDIESYYDSIPVTLSELIRLAKPCSK